MIGEAELGLNYGLSFFAHVHTLTELVGIFIEEEK